MIIIQVLNRAIGAYTFSHWAFLPRPVQCTFPSFCISLSTLRMRSRLRIGRWEITFGITCILDHNGKRSDPMICYTFLSQSYNLNVLVYETFGISKRFSIKIQVLLIRAETLDKPLTAKCFIYDVTGRRSLISIVIQSMFLVLFRL